MENDKLKRLHEKVGEILIKCDKVYENLNAIDILNLNFDNPPEATIASNSREWRIIINDCDLFANNYSEIGNDKCTKLNQAIKNMGNKISKNDIDNLVVILHSIKSDIDELIFKNKNISIDLTNKKQVKPPKVFISHSYNDKEYVEYFVQLLEDIGLNEKQLFCSSISPYNIPLDEDIYEYLKSEFENYSLRVVFILSDKYYNSAACLNEMGAAWVLKTNYHCILLPEFDYKSINGAINPNRISIKLGSEDCKSRINELKDVLVKNFGLQEISQNKWERNRDKFLDNIENLKNSTDIEEKLKEALKTKKENSNKDKFLENILQDEIVDNLKRMLLVKNLIGQQEFGLLDILKVINEDKFVAGEFHQLLIPKMDTEMYDKIESELLDIKSKNAENIILLYKQFKLWNKREDLINFSKDEYIKFRRIILNELSKYVIESK